MSSTTSNSAQIIPKRANIACQVCREKKVKCFVKNGERRCQHCIRHGVDRCVFAPVNEETRFTQSSQGTYLMQQFRVDRPTDYANQPHNAPPPSSLHSWNLHSGDAVPSPPLQRTPVPPRVPALQRVPAPHQPSAYQRPASLDPSHETFPPSPQYYTFALDRSQQQHGQQAGQLYPLVDNSNPGSWVPGQPSNYPNQGAVFPGSDPQQSMATPASSSTYPQYAHPDPNIPWPSDDAADIYYPEQNND